MGSLPTELALLTGLTHFVATSNALEGSLGGALSGVSSLTTLNLNTNMFTGTIPISVLSQNTDLTTLNLGQNKFTGTIPTNLPLSLTDLSIPDNGLTGSIPPDLKNTQTIGM